MSNGIGWTEADVVAHLAKLALPLGQEATPATPKKKPRQPRTGYRSKTEARYAQHLELMQKAGQIRSWMYEPLALKLAPGCVYWPDFLILDAGVPGFLFQELKGRKGAGFWSMPVSKVKIRLAAQCFPFFRFEIVWPNARLGEWERMPVGAAPVISLDRVSSQPSSRL